jgi:hypothetical protein
MHPFELPSTCSNHSYRVPVRLARLQKLQRLRQRLAAIEALIRSLEEYERLNRKPISNCVEITVGRKGRKASA